MHYTEVSFPRKEKEFFTTLQNRIRKHFEDTGTSRYGNATMHFKTIFMVCMYLVPFIILLTGYFTSPWLYFIGYVIMGFGVAGIGLSIMHDANHGAYSKNQKVNKYVGWIINLVGGYHINWQLQHNVLHHTFTNVDGVDEDINPGKILRFSPHKERRPSHRYQHIYAWGLYSLMTILWITSKDITQMIRYRDSGLLSQIKKPFSVLFTQMIALKIGYYLYALVLPLLLFPIAWYWTVAFFLMMQFIAGLTLGAIFQAAHVMPCVEYPLPNEEGKLENHWAVHQLQTTVNFANNNFWLNWYCGGLNFQIEHHLFPNICHVHYKKISKIVKATAQEYGLPYNSIPNFRGALREHTKMLYRLGHQDDMSIYKDELKPAMVGVA